MATLYSDTDDRVWKAISDGKRRCILDALAEGPKLTGEIVDMFPAIGRTGVLKHLDVLAGADLISIRREGRKRWNYLNPKPIRALCGPWVARHVEGITSSIARLKGISEAPNK